MMESSKTGRGSRQLGGLRWQLRTLWWQRSFVRLLAAGSVMAIAVLVSLLALFVLDVLFDMDSLQRAVALALAFASSLWCFYRFSWPFLARWEDRTELALLVERGSRIDNDFVAALQFAESKSTAGGSNQLRAAVIRRAAEQARHVRFSDAISYRAVGQRVGALLLTTVATGCAILSGPDHARAFVNRLMFRPIEYPTSTVVEQVIINSKVVLARPRDGNVARETAAAEESPVDFWILASGQVPDIGQVRIDAAAAGQIRNVELKTVSLGVRSKRLRDARTAIQQAVDHAALTDSLRSRVRELLVVDAATAAEVLERQEPLAPGQLTVILREIDIAQRELELGMPRSLFHGRLERLGTSISYRVRLGDSRLDAARVRMIPLPIVELTGQVTPPLYAASMASSIRPGTLQFSVLEGSAVTFTLRGHNKSLASAWVVVEQEGHEIRTELQPTGTSGFEWSGAGPPQGLGDVRDDVRFQLDVRDGDGLGLPRPLKGAIHVRRDEAPLATLSAIHRVLVPTAKPVLEYRVTDDFAIAQIRLRARIASSKASGVEESSPGSDRGYELEIPLPAETVTELPLQGNVPFDLARLSPVAGETVSVVLEAVDDRGRAEGRSSTTEPLLLEVADESAVLSSISEMDQQTERRLTEIIQRQLEVRSTQ